MSLLLLDWRDTYRYALRKDDSIVDLSTGRVMSRFIRNGYICVRLCDSSGNFHNVYLHRIKACALLPNPNNLPCVNHIDGNKQNNSVDNLEWCDYSYNLKHAYRHGLRRAKHILCLETGEEYESVTSAATQTGIKRTALHECLSGRNKTCAKMHWAYC